jgi:hypothetical protein
LGFFFHFPGLDFLRIATLMFNQKSERNFPPTGKLLKRSTFHIIIISIYRLMFISVRRRIPW